MIKIDNLEKNYGSFSLNVSMQIPAGRVSGIVGRNGVGKSTLIKSVLGLIRPDGGTVLTIGKNPLDMTPQDRLSIGIAMSDSGFSTYLNVRDIAGILSRMYPDFDSARFMQQCNDSGLGTDKRIKDFSTGMRARLKVLVACSHQAKLLILDEPTAGLDIVARREILDMLRNYLSQDNERTMLISSHISSDLEGICDDVYMIHNGRIILHEDTDTILGDYAVLKLSRARYEEIDRRYIIRVREESFGYSCFTNQKQFYADNYPDIVIESGSIDELIIMMAEGELK